MSAAAASAPPIGAASPVATIAVRAFRDRLKLALYSGIGLAALSMLGIGAFSSLNSQDLFNNLPAAFDSLIGGTAGGNYVVSEVFGLIAPIVVLVVAISGGVNAVAGEERDGTAGLLLAQPAARRDLVVAKAAVVAAHLLLTVGILLSGFLAASVVFDSGLGAGNVIATTLHLLALGLAFAMIALALSAWTGMAAVSLGAAAGLAVLANLTAAMLPLVNGLQDGAKASPWYYYNGSEPLVNGLDLTHLVVLLVIAAAGFAAALSGVERRDIDSGSHGRGLSIPALGRFTRPRVDSIFAKSLSERVTVITVAGSAMISMAIAISLMFDGLQQTLGDLSKNVPESVAGLYGGGDLGTAVGWINAEMVSIMLPAALIALAVVLGVAAVAGEQKRHTLDLLLAAPVTRRRIVVEKATASVICVVAVGVLSAAGILVGSEIAGLSLDASNVAAAVTHATLLALFFGSLALALGAAASAQAALRVTVVAALVSYMAQAFLPSLDALKDGALLSPWHYFSSSNPLANGFDVAHLAVLAALTATAFTASLVLVDRRDVSA